MGKSGKTHKRATRDDLTSLVARPVRSPLIKPTTFDFLSKLTEVDDARTFSPEIARPARSILSRSATQLVAPRKAQRVHGRTTVPHAVGFARPREVVICVRRKERREVIHALRKNGRGGKRARWSEWSHINCK